MRAVLKFALWLAAAALVLFAALAIAVTLLFDPDDYRPLLVDTVEDATGRSFEITGELGLRVFPCCAVSVGSARLGNPPGFPEDTFASLRSAALSLELWPLLVNREVSIGTVTLDGVEANLVQLADGRSNWVFDSGAEEAPAGPDDGDAGSGLPALSIDAFVLTDGGISYRDAAAELSYTLSDVSLQTGAVSYGTGEATAFPVEGALTITDEVEGARARVGLAARVALDGGLDRIILENTTVEVEASGPRIPGGDGAANISAEALTASLGEEIAITVEAFSATVRALDSRLTVTGHGRAGSANAELEGELTLEDTSPRAWLAALAEGAGEAPWQPADPDALTSLSASGKWSVTASAASVHDLAVQLDDTTLTGAAAVENFAEPAVTFELAVNALNVDGYLPADDDGDGDSAAPSEPATPSEPAAPSEPVPLSALAEVDVDGTIRVDALRVSGAEIAGLEALLESRNGDVSVELAARTAGGRLAVTGGGNVAGSKPTLAGRITLEKLSLRQLLAAMGSPPDTANPDALTGLAGSTRWSLTPTAVTLEDMAWQLDGTRITGRAAVDDLVAMAVRFDIALDRMNLDDYLPAETGAPAPEEEAETEIPVEVIRGLDLDGRLRAGELVMMGMPLGQVSAQVNAHDGVLRLEPLTASVYGGQYQGRVAVDATGPQAVLTLDQSLSAVQVSDVLGQLFDVDALSGSLSLELAGQGTGNTPTELLRGIAADVSFDLSDGVYRGVDVVYELRRARALLENEAVPEAPASRETPIRTLKAAGHMVDGVLQTKALSAETSALRLAGEGGINLMALTLDYELSAEVLKSAAAAMKLGDLTGVAIPLALNGPLTSPRVSVDLKGLVTSTLRNTVEQRAREALFDRLGVGEETAIDGQDDNDAEPPAEPAKKPSARDLLERGLRDLLKPPPGKDEAEESSVP